MSFKSGLSETHSTSGFCIRTGFAMTKMCTAFLLHKWLLLCLSLPPEH